MTDGRVERFCSAGGSCLNGEQEAQQPEPEQPDPQHPATDGKSPEERVIRDRNQGAFVSLSTPAGLGAPAAAAETIPLAQGRRLEVGDASSLKGRAPWRLSIGTLVNPLWLSGWDGAGTIWRWWVRIF